MIAGLIFFFGACNSDSKSETTTGQEQNRRDVPGLKVKRELTINSDKAADGYILFNPTSSGSTYLMDREGQILHEWKGYFHSWLAYLMNDGRVIRNAVDPDAPVFYAGGMAGRMDEIDANGQVTWEYEYADEDHQIHHDIQVLPNGNILSISWDHRTRDELIKAGRNPDHIPMDGLWFDKIIEVEPTRPKGGNIVWEWRLWDHLVQNTDPALPNYGNPADHPELMDINVHGEEPPKPMDPDTLLKLKLAEQAHRNQTIYSEGADIFHCNAVNFNADLDQIVFSSPHISEIFIIDHSTTTAEAAGHTGGRYGRGGDFLYRWGNPHNYLRGDSTDQKLFGQHDVRWIEDGFPGAGHLSLYNNLVPGPDSINHSEIFEIETPVNAEGSYTMLSDGTYGPESPSWTYAAPDTLSLFSPFTSGAMRLKNGNTFILQGAAGRMLEVTSDGEIVWEYWNPYRGHVREPNGDAGDAAPFFYWLFRSTFIPADHPALQYLDLTPLDPQPEVFTVEE